MSRVLLHLSQLDDAEFDKTVGGMTRARFLKVAMFHNRAVAEALVGFEVAPWPSTEPTMPTRPSSAMTERRGIASQSLAFVFGQPGVPLNSVHHGYALRLSLIQDAIEDLRAHTKPYDTPWAQPGSFDPATDLGPAWATYYHSAIAHAVGGAAGDARLNGIGAGLDAEACLTGVLEIYTRLRSMCLTHRPAAFASIDASDHYFDPAPVDRAGIDQRAR
ncbi:MAG: hypothetical protein U0R78_02400 [Nocardioidaceae bacterium]